jgi:hypothetical protein
MRRELEQKLVERWPSWFNIHGDPLETRMADGFAHGDGWFEIVWRLCEDLEPLAAEAEKAAVRPFEVQQVKEKFGGLRFYVSASHRTDAILQRIEIAESESLRTCEMCGKPGKRRENDCIRTVCNEHVSL